MGQVMMRMIMLLLVVVMIDSDGVDNCDDLMVFFLCSPGWP